MINVYAVVVKTEEQMYLYCVCGDDAESALGYVLLNRLERDRGDKSDYSMIVEYMVTEGYSEDIHADCQPMPTEGE